MTQYFLQKTPGDFAMNKKLHPSEISGEPSEARPTEISEGGWGVEAARKIRIRHSLAQDPPSCEAGLGFGPQGTAKASFDGTEDRTRKAAEGGGGSPG